MATVNGVYATKYANPIGTNIVEGAYVKAKVLSFYDEYEASSLSAGDIITVGPALPNGAILLGAVIRFDALGASTTLQLGDSADDDRYIPAASTSSAGALNFQSGTSGHIDNGYGYVIGTNSGDNQLYVKLAGASGTGTIKIMVEYAARG